MARDRSPEAVARAFLAKHRATAPNAALLADLVRAVRRECARVARGLAVPDEAAGYRSTEFSRGFTTAAKAIAEQIAALNRAPRGGRSRG